MVRPFVIANALVVLFVHAAAAQQPTQAQRDAIRASCRSDFMANCAGVTPGGKDALECLLRNQAKLSSACNSAVSAVVPAKPAPAPAAAATPAVPATAAPASPPSADTPAKSEEPAAKSAASQETQLKAVRQSCTLNDFMAHCSWIKPDNPELLLCLQANVSDLSQPCQAAVQGVKGAPAPAAETPAAVPERKATSKSNTTKSKKSTVSHEAPSGAPSAVPTPAAASATAPTEAQKSAIRAACRSDFMANCSGVQPGGVEALQCLKSHAARLSGACQSAVAAIGGSAAPSASASAPAASAPASAVAPLGPIPMMRPREALGILAMCRAEHETLCADAPPGGGRILNCLADHAQQLSPQCYGALSRAAR